MPTHKIVKGFLLSALSIPVFAFASLLFPSTTLAASNLVIYPYTISSGNPDATSATITWQTNLAGTSSLSIGPTTSYGIGYFSAISSTTHTLTVSGLSPATTYHYELFSYDSSGDVATSSDQTLTTVNSCTYYVDSVNGSDSNNGTDANTPFQSLTKMDSILLSNNAVICLRRGSYFTDQLIIGGAADPINNVTVEDYGPANLSKPIIDGSNVIASSSWTAVGGSYPNVYQATVATPFLNTNGTPESTSTPYGAYTGSGAGVWVNVWECKTAPCTATAYGGNDAFMRSGATSVTTGSLSDAQTNADTAYIPGMTENNNPSTSTPQNGITVYVHPSGNTNPQTNGYTYSYASKDGQLVIFGQNAIVKNIVVKKGNDNNGELIQYDAGGGAGGATFYGVEADQGSKHNMYCTEDCTVNNSVFGDGYYPDGNTMLVPFSAAPQALPATCNNCQFDSGMTTSGGEVGAFYSHSASGNGTYGPIVFNGGILEGVNGAFLSGISAAALSMTLSGITCLDSFSCLGTSGTTTVSNDQIIGDSVPVTVPSSSYTTIGNALMCGPFQHGAVNVFGSNATAIVSTSTIYDNGANNAAGIYSTAANSLLELFNTIIASDATFSYWVLSNQATSSTQYIGDYNSFVLPNLFQGQLGANTFFPLSTWQASTSQDTHTNTAAPTAGGNSTATSTACAPSTLTLSGPSSGSVNASSSNFTVTPNRVFTGTTTISFTGAGSAGLTPINLTWNNSSAAQTFTIAPTATGSISVVPFSTSATTSPAFVMATSTTSVGSASLAAVTLTYTSNITVPSSPYGPILATAGNTTATVSWSAPVSIGGSAVTGYTVAASSGGFSTTTTNTSATLTGLSNGTPYTFTVTATNAAGVSASSTASNSVTPSTLPVLSTGAASSITPTSAILSGAIASTSGSNATDSGFIYGYTDPTLAIGVATSSLGPQTGTTTLVATVSGLNSSTEYYFESYAVNASGIGYGPILSFITSAAPVTQAIYSTSGGGGTVSISDLASILAPSAAATAYLNSLKAGTAYVPSMSCPVGWICTPPATTGTTLNPFNGGVVGSNPHPSEFTESLQLGSTGDEVKLLQEYLNTHGYAIAPSGPGSPGNETDMFGSLTKTALIKFQKANNIVPDSGYFGPITRAFIES